jgi:hypothetical protein
MRVEDGGDEEDEATIILLLLLLLLLLFLCEEEDAAAATAGTGRCDLVLPSRPTDHRRVSDVVDVMFLLLCHKRSTGQRTRRCHM